MKRHRKFSFLVGEGPLGGGHSLGVNAAAHLSDGRVVTAGRDATVRVWEGGSVVAVYSDHADIVHDVAVPPSSGIVASCSSDNTICLYNHQKLIDMRCCHTDAVRKLKFISSSRLVSASLDGTVCVSDLRGTGNGGETVVATQDPLFALAVGANEGKNIVVAGSARGHVYLFDPRALRSAEELLQPTIRAAHDSSVRDLAFCDGGSKLASCGADSTIKIWDMRTMRSPVTIIQHTDAVFSLVTTPGSSLIFSGSRDGTVSVTNVTTLESCCSVVSQHPIVHVSVSPRSILYACTTKSSVDGYVLSNVLPHSMITAQSSSSGGKQQSSPLDGSRHNQHRATTPYDDITTPSKVTIDLSTPDDNRRLSVDAQQAHHHSSSKGKERVAPLCLVDAPSRRYESPFLRKVAFASKDQEKQWCTSLRTGRPAGINPVEPDISLEGSTHAILQCALLNDKRHVLSIDESQDVVLWSITSQEQLHQFPRGTQWKDALEQSNVNTHCGSWCTVECRWGCICVTVSFESSLDTWVNDWWLKYVSRPKVPGAHHSLQLSTYSLSRRERQALMQKPLKNLCEMALCNLFASKRTESVLVWNVPQGNTPLGSGKRFVISKDDTVDDILRQVPAWVANVVNVPEQVLQISSTAVHTVELVSFDGVLPSMKQTQFNIPRRRIIADLAKELAAALKVKLPKTKELLDGLARAPSSSALGFSTGGNLDDDGFTPLLPEEFIEFVPAQEDGQPNPNLTVDPLMQVGTAFFLYKEKGSGVLRLWYRKNKFLAQ